MIKKMIVIPAVLALSVSFSQATFAHEHNMSMKKGHGHQQMCMQGMMQKLALTADQKMKIKEIRAKERKEMEGNMREMQTLRHDMRRQVESDKMDEAKLTALIHQRKELMASMMKLKMMAKHEIYNVLDAKQKAEYTQMSNHCEEMRMER